MNITLSLNIARPEHLIGKSNNFKLLTELVDLLDGVCVVESVALHYVDKFGIVLAFSLEDDPMNEPICVKAEAWDWALEKLVRELPWAIQSEAVLSFHPDQPPITAKEREADRNLGDRPFGG